MIILCLLPSCCLHAEAAADPLGDMQETLHQLEIPLETANLLDAAGMTADDSDSIGDFDPQSGLKTFLHAAAAETAEPLRIGGRLLALTILLTLLGSLSDAAAETSVRQTFDTVSAVICISAAASPLCGCLEQTAEALRTGQAFMASFIPVFAGFLAAGGSVAGGAAYHVFVLFLTETVMQLANGLLFPLLQWGTALGLADAVNPKLRLGQFVGGFRTAVTWLLGTGMALFSALLSVRSFVASAADSLAAKSAKLLTSNMIPVIGSAVSDAYGTVQGSIILLRNSAGAVGILVIVWLTVPPLLSLLCYRAVFRLLQIVSEAAGTEMLSSLYRNAQTVLSAAFAILICYAVMLIFSSAIMMILLGNR